MIRIHSCFTQDVTVVSNEFLDHFLPAANGDYLRVYLYLLRIAGMKGDSMSLGSIADRLNLTEGDVRRALSYWEKEHALTLGYGGDGAITEIAFANFCNPGYSPDAAVHKEAPAEKEDADLPHVEDPTEVNSSPAEKSKAAPAQEEKPQEISRARMEELGQREEIRELFFIAMQYLERPLSRTEMQKICYFYDELQFSPDLIDYLMEYCIGRGHKSFRYIEKVALAWKEEGIASVHDARIHVGSYHKEYYDILKALGINNHHPVEAEIRIMKKWIETWHFNMDIIREACTRTVMNATKPTLNYADGILSRWFQSGVKTPDDIKVLDEEHARRMAASRGEDSAKDSKTVGTVSKSAREAQNFEQRNYDYAAIERALLRQS